jgi:hypothetical protein
MLRAGFFENFKGADTLLIWGDEQGLARLQQLLAQLPSRAGTSAAIQEIEGIHVRPSLKIMFELGSNELRVDSNGADVVILASCSADMLATFASKVAGLADPKCRTGHQYLEWPGGANIVVMVSKGEYPDDFGDA